MGSCFSKKSNRRAFSPAKPPENSKSATQFDKKKPQETPVKKEVFIIKHRKSHEVERQRVVEAKKMEESVEKCVVSNSGVASDGGAPPGNSISTKEEVDAILIQCGRLSRNSSTSKGGVSSENNERAKLGLIQRSYDFDNEPEKSEGKNVAGDDYIEDTVARERENRRRERSRQSQGRRRTLSREREKDLSSQHRSGSKERGNSSGGGGGRRVSRSPGRRSQSPISTNSNSNSNSFAINAKSSKPGKMVSVPATVPEKRIPLKRNAGGETVPGTRTTASPRNRSPARVNTTNDTQQPPSSLSRSNSKKATENSPLKRNPLSEINNIISQVSKSFNKSTINAENLKLLNRTRSSRLSRDFEAQDTKISSYTALLLEDIQNFHQKSAPPSGFSLPPCLTKACSILEAVADLNSSIGSSFSTTLMEDQRREKIRKCTEIRSNTAKDEIEEPIFESVIVGTDDLMAPSFQKYVNGGRGVMGLQELCEQESSGSNSVTATSFDPNSAESTVKRLSSSTSKQIGVKGDKRSFNSKKNNSPHRQKRIQSRVSTPVVTAAASY